MNNILAFDVVSPSEVALQIAARVKTRRLELNLTQEGMAADVYKRQVPIKKSVCSFSK